MIRTKLQNEYEAVRRIAAEAYFSTLRSYRRSQQRNRLIAAWYQYTVIA